MIISLVLTLVVALQSCTIVAAGSLAQDRDMSGGGAGGILVALLFVIGGAFAMGLPKISTLAFMLAAVLGFVVGAQGRFTDMTIWGVVAVILAVMSYFGDRELEKVKGTRR